MDAPPSSSEPADLLAGLRAVGAAAPGWDEVDVERGFQVFSAILRGFLQHEQRPLSTAVHLFEAEDAHPGHPRPPTLGWEAHARVARHVVGGTHFTALGEANVDRLASALSAVLRPFA